MISKDTDIRDVRIGLEVHARLLTRSKAFCGCETDASAEANTAVCPVCMGLPGTLPVPNRRMTELAVLAGLAFGSHIHRRSVFSRKMYSYPDLPKGYQITQHKHPVCNGGALKYRGADGTLRELPLWRLHLEEDAAKLTHTNGAVHVDFNRCGAPLLEIVTAPELRSVDDTAEAVKEIRRMLLFLGICDGQMALGSFRCDVNVSVAHRGGESSRTEIKNLNSFAAIRQALLWEIERQRNSPGTGADRGHTTHWNQDSGAGSTMRSKEAVHEYRFSVEPDLPDLEVTDEMLEHAKAELTELPLDRETRFVKDFGLSPEQSAVLCANPDTAAYFEELLALVGEPVVNTAKLAANWVCGELFRHSHALGAGIANFPVRPDALAELLCMVTSGEIYNSSAKKVFEAMLASGARAQEAAVALGVPQPADQNLADALLADIILRFPQQVQTWQAGKTSVFAFLMGELVRSSGGRIDPREAARRLEAALRKHRTGHAQSEAST